MNVYDFDKTLYKRDSTVDFIMYCYKKQPKLILCLPKQIYGIILYVLKIIDITKLKEYLYIIFAHVENIDKLLNDFWDQNMKDINEFYQHKEDDLVISASPDFIVSIACSRLNIKHCICSLVDKQTGKVLNINNSKQQKVINMKKQGYDTDSIDEFYSDSYNDQPLALLAKKAYLIKKGKKVDWIFK